MESRREFLAVFLACGAPALLSGQALGQQPRPPQQAPPQRASKKDSDEQEDDDSPKFDSKAALEGNKKDIKKDVERLFQLASELKGEVEKTDSVQVLSLAMLKKTEEIEKLAKEIRSRAIG